VTFEGDEESLSEGEIAERWTRFCRIEAGQPPLWPRIPLYLPPILEGEGGASG
jgi:hypothetical protein